VREEQRYDHNAFARGIQAMVRGEDSHRATAAARNIANVITMHAMSLGSQDWKR
jgi:hypothetical protein